MRQPSEPKRQVRKLDGQVFTVEPTQVMEQTTALGLLLEINDRVKARDKKMGRVYPQLPPEEKKDFVAEEESKAKKKNSNWCTIL